ncbi:MAG: 1-acyl-sn-glycerol-3-phosphate acyltransferase [Polyangiaceae bacterium]|nr:1-acyl-sn-glycerol-3-phosphate acyltransferase [Polyangiaceae bacterium]
MSRARKRLAPAIPPATLGDVARSAILWGYFLAVFAAGYWLVIMATVLVSRPRSAGAQRAIHGYFRVFFALVRAIAPRVTFVFPDLAEVYPIRSSIIVANHQSLLDPPLLLALLPRASTMVRADFFRIPIFGWVLRACGYVHAQGEEGPAWMEDFAQQLATGGNVFLFPEGTRSRNGELGRFRRGAFHVARRLGVPIEVLRIDGTGRVFPPGEVVLRLSSPASVCVRRVAHLSAEEVAAAPDTESLIWQVQGLIARAATAPGPRRAASLPTGEIDHGGVDGGGGGGGTAEGAADVGLASGATDVDGAGAGLGETNWGTVPGGGCAAR